MFDETILDSSPLRAPVVTRRHYIIAVMAGTAGFLVALKLFPLLLTSTRMPVLAGHSSVAGIALMFYILMLCYVHADARRLGLCSWAWTGLVLLMNLFGFVLYLAYSAARTQDWKRATMPLAYILEMGLIGALLLMPLIYTAALPPATLSGMILAPSPPAAPPIGRRTAIRHIAQAELLAAPVRVPRIITAIRDEPDEAAQGPGPGVVGSVPGGFHGATGVVPYGFGPIGPPPPPVQDGNTTNPKAAPIRVGGQVEAAKLVFQVKPEYPPLAKMARIPGKRAVGSVDWYGRDHSEPESSCRSPVAREGGHRRCSKVALSAHTLER